MEGFGDWEGGNNGVYSRSRPDFGGGGVAGKRMMGLLRSVVGESGPGIGACGEGG